MQPHDLLRILTDFIDSRTGLIPILKGNLTGYRVPKNVTIWHSLGAVLLKLFGIQFLTGFFLLIYYTPETGQAYASVERIMNDIPFGWLIRYLHVVGANLIIVALLLHMLSVLFQGSYKRPREFTWIIGFTMFNLALAMCLTGYLLPWSQLSFWATTVATEGIGSIPVAGDLLLQMVRGGESVGQATLGRFFALHVLGLPLALGGLVGAHLYLVRRLGIARVPQGKEPCLIDTTAGFRHEEHPDGIPFFPNYVVKEIAVVSFFLAALAGFALIAPTIFFPEAAFDPADPFVTPSGIKPEWYFLWAYQTLKIFPSEFLGLAAQGGFMTFLALLPFIDRSTERNPARRPVFVACYVLIVLIFIGISIWGHLS